MRLTAVLAGLALVAGCAGIPPVNTGTISATPAPADQIAKAREAVSICSRLPDADAMFASFAAKGHQAGRTRMELNNGKELIGRRTLSYTDGDVIVQASEKTCYIGVRGMTPEQSFQLAQPWVARYGAVTNAEFGDGLSEHVVQAWRVQTGPVPTVLIAANKTWPWDRGRWPDEPGAAVTLHHNASR